MNEPTPLNPPRRGEVLDPRAPDFAERSALQWALYGENWIGVNGEVQSFTRTTIVRAAAAWADAHPGEVVFTRRQPRRSWRFLALLRRLLTLECEPMHDVFGDDEDVASFPHV